MLSALLVVLILGALAFGLPYTVSDGTEKFTGKEARVAKWAIGDGGYDGPSVGPIPNPTVTFRAKVTNVQKTDTEKRCSTSGGIGDPGIVYMVEISRVTFFGILAPGYETPYCVTNLY